MKKSQCRLLRILGRSVLAPSAMMVFAVTNSAAAGDTAMGAAAFVRQCALCHTAGRGQPNRFGPNLFGIVNKKAGTAPDFTYSPAFKSAASYRWSPDLLGAWISAPATMIPGTKMGVFQGVADRDRDDIVAYLAAQK